MKPKKLKTKMWRENARRTREEQWQIMEGIVEHGTIWFCPWDKDRHHTGAGARPPDLVVHGLIDGMEVAHWWAVAHPDWFVVGEWSDDRYAYPIQLTEAGRRALAERAKYDMEPVFGGLVEPGWQAVPSPKAGVPT